MRLSNLGTRIVSVPIEPAVRTPIHYIKAVDNVLVEIGTDEGVAGIAYLWCFGLDQARALEALVRDLFSLVEGMSALEREAIGAAISNHTNFMGRGGAAWIAASAIDTALWDIAGKHFNVPVWKLLGGSDRPIHAYAGGFFLSDSIDVVVQEARDRLVEGFTALKMRCGAPTLAEDVDRVAAVREVIGPDVTLMIDVVQGWSVERAIRTGKALASFDLYYIEDPVRFDDIEGMARVADALDTPVAAGENDYGRHGFRKLIEARAVDIAMIDLQRAGGISEWMKIAAMAQAWNMPVVPHVFHEMSIHLLAATPHALFLEYMPWWEPLFNQTFRLKDGAFHPPSEPGLALSFNDEQIERHLVSVSQ
jgi:L-alanine-DL-glutamate epimerase-like enolase superfamily enzyme